MDDKNPGTVALVTGGYKNLGYHISASLKEAGYEVVATYRRDRHRAEETAAKLHIPVYHADLTIGDDVAQLFERIEANDGIVNVLVNNASSFPTGPLMDLSTEDFEDAFRSSVFASNMMIKRSLPGMLETGRGSIVNIGMAGIGTIRGYTHVAAHAAAKTSLAVLTLSWARELKGKNINVNMISPGIIDQGWWNDEWSERMRKISPSGALTPPEEVAKAARYLVSRNNITGMLIDVDPSFQPPEE